MDIRINRPDSVSENNVLTWERRFQLAKRITKEERETIIRFDETDGPVVIYTFNSDLKKRLKSFAKKHPELCSMTAEDKDFGSITYEIEKSRLSIRLTAPYSEERRKADSERAKKAGIAPPGRRAKSQTE